MTARSGTCYVVLSHRNPMQVRRLCERLGSAGGRVVLHHDPAGRPVDWGGSIPPWVTVLAGRHVEWGTFGVVDAMLRGIRAGLGVTEAPWFVFLSGQDYPIKPMAAVEASIASRVADAYIDLLEIPDADPWPVGEASSRYGYTYWRIPSGSVRARVVSQLAAKVLPIVGNRAVTREQPGSVFLGFRSARAPLNSIPKLFVGSQWFSVSRPTAARIADASSPRGQFVRGFKRTLIPDEAFFHTMLGSWPDVRSVPADDRLVVWESGAHPRVLNFSDADRLKRSMALFARKLDSETDPEFVDWIDVHLL